MQILTPLKAIRAKCLDCCCGSSHEVKLCTAENCPLWPFRYGKNPNRAGMGGSGRFKAKQAHSTPDFSENSLPECIDTTEDTNAEKNEASCRFSAAETK